MYIRGYIISVALFIVVTAVVTIGIIRIRNDEVVSLMHYLPSTAQFVIEAPRDLIFSSQTDLVVEDNNPLIELRVRSREYWALLEQVLSTRVEKILWFVSVENEEQNQGVIFITAGTLTEQDIVSLAGISFSDFSWLKTHQDLRLQVLSDHVAALIAADDLTISNRRPHEFSASGSDTVYAYVSPEHLSVLSEQFDLENYEPWLAQRLASQEPVEFHMDVTENYLRFLITNFSYTVAGNNESSVPPLGISEDFELALGGSISEVFSSDLIGNPATHKLEEHINFLSRIYTTQTSIIKEAFKQSSGVILSDNDWLLVSSDIDVLRKLGAELTSWFQIAVRTDSLSDGSPYKELHKYPVEPELQSIDNNEVLVWSTERSSSSLALAGYETDAGIRTDAAGVDLYFTRHAKYSYLTNSLELLKMQFSSSGERSTVDRDIKSCLRSSVYEAAIIDSILIGNKTEKFDFSKNAEQFIFLHGYAPASGGFIAICLR